MRKYNVGDRIFFEYYDKSIGTKIILSIEDDEYTENGKTYKFKRFITGKHTFIEDYNCLSQNDPRVKEIKKTYEEFDKNKKDVIEVIKNLTENLSLEMKEDLLDEIKDEIMLSK